MNVASMQIADLDDSRYLLFSTRSEMTSFFNDFLSRNDSDSRISLQSCEVPPLLDKAAPYCFKVVNT